MLPPLHQQMRGYIYIYIYPCVCARAHLWYFKNSTLRLFGWKILCEDSFPRFPVFGNI